LKAVELLALVITFETKLPEKPKKGKVFLSVFNSPSRKQGEQNLVKRFTIPVKTSNFCLSGQKDAHGTYNATEYNLRWIFVKSSPSTDRWT